MRVEALAAAMATAFAEMEAARSAVTEVRRLLAVDAAEDAQQTGGPLAAQHLVREADQQRLDAVGRQWQAEAREQRVVDEAKVEVVKERAWREAAEMSLEEEVRRRVAAAEEQEATEARAIAAEERAEEAERRAAALEAEVARCRQLTATAGGPIVVPGESPEAAPALTVAEAAGGGDGGELSGASTEVE